MLFENFELYFIIKTVLIERIWDVTYNFFLKFAYEFGM